MKPRSLAILIAVSGVAAGAAYFATRGDTRPAPETEKLAALFPGLNLRADEVASITITSASGVSTVERTDGVWRLKEKAGYPADAAKVRELVLTLASLTDLTARTSLAERYKAIGVEDVASAAAPADATAVNAAGNEAPLSRAVLVTMADKSGAVLGSVIVGNSIQSPDGTQGVYVRKPGDAKSYAADLGARRFDVPRLAINWVDAKFADIGRERVWTVDVMPRDNADTDRVIIARDTPGAGAFAVKNLPPGRELKNPGFVETVVSAPAHASFEEVAEVSTIDFDGPAGGKPGPTVRVRTGDGLIVDVSTTEQNGRTWWKLTASADPDPYKEVPPPSPPAPVSDPEGATPPSPAPPPPGGDEPKPRRSAAEVAKEVTGLNAKWSDWAFSPFEYKATAWKTTLTEQLKEPTPPPAPTPLPTAPSSVEPKP